MIKPIKSGYIGLEDLDGLMGLTRVMDLKGCVVCEIDDENMKARGFSGSLTLTHRYWFSPYKDTKTRQVALTHGVGGGDKNILIKIAKLDFLASIP